MDGSDIDWEALDHELDNMEAEAYASERPCASAQLSSEEYEEPTEMVELQDNKMEEPEEPENLEEAQIEACQKYFEIQTDGIEELVMPASWVTELQEIWQDFIQRVGSRQAAGEIIYDAVKEAAPRIVIDDFRIPRPVWSSRFVDGISSLIAEAKDLKMLRKRAEAMGFSHISLALSIEKCELLRDVVVSSIEQECGAGKFSVQCVARKALTIVLNYIAGALLNTQDMFGSRVRAIERSWRQANNNSTADTEMDGSEIDQHVKVHGQLVAEDIDKERFREMSQAAKKRRKGLNVPKTFNEMFLFNSCVMGYEDSLWMDLVLHRLNALASNVCQLLRLQEECDVLSLFLTRYLNPINYAEFKVVLLATLRSLVKEWNMEMDVAWNWFWDRIVGMLSDRKTLLTYKKKLGTALTTADEQTFQSLRRMLFARFFADMPSAQEYLKTSMTRLYFVADRIIQMTFELLDNPEKMIEEISSVALMHVGMNIPREFFKPFRRAAQETFQAVIQNEVAAQGFSWSILLVTRVMTRVIAAGSTVVMKAVCLHNETALYSSMAIAPRSERALQLLSVRAGGQTTSPLYWAINTGTLRCASIIIEDLLTIRADRDHYYYGCDTLFDVHPELIHRLCNSAPTLLQPLLDGLVWRSRTTQQGMRRVNYYIKNLLQDKDGEFSKSIEWLVNYNDPQAISHPTSTLAVNLLWSGLAMPFFLASRAFFMLSLCAFMAGQSILIYHDGTERYHHNIAVAGCRGFTFLLSMPSLILDHVRHLYSAFSLGEVHRTSMGVPIPLYLCNMPELLSLVLALTLMIMMILEPILWCLGELSEMNSPFLILTTNCKEADAVRDVYSVCASFASLLYWMLIMDLAVFSMRLYAFLLVCGQVIWEVFLFLAVAVFMIIAFSTALNALEHSIDVEGVPAWSRMLGQVITQMVPTSFYSGLQSSGPVFMIVSLFAGSISFLLLNLLAGQLIEAYPNSCQDLEGRARLSRAGILVRMMEQVLATQVGHRTFDSFIESLRFDEPLEFNEGDIGLPGGVQVLENANDSVVTVDRILRYGGSTSPALPWPEDEKKTSVRQERFQRLENLFLRAKSKQDGGHVKAGNSFERKAQKKRSLTFTNAMAMFNSSNPFDASG